MGRNYFVCGTTTWLNYWNLTSSVFLSRYTINHYWILWISPAIFHYKSQIILNKNQEPPKEIRLCINNITAKQTNWSQYCPQFRAPHSILRSPTAPNHPIFVSAWPNRVKSSSLFSSASDTPPLACIVHVLSRVSYPSVSTKHWSGSVHFTPNLTTSRFRLI